MKLMTVRTEDDQAWKEIKMLKHDLEDGSLVVFLSGKMDAVHSEQMEQEIMEAVRQQPDVPLILDAEDLIYISSSGLRALMRIARDEEEANQTVTIRGVSPEVYEIFEVTGMDDILTIQKRMRRIDVEGCPVIGQGAFGTVYRLDADTVVKVFRNGKDSIPLIRDETDKARSAFVNGVPTAIPFDIVHVGDQYGSVYEMIDANNANDELIENPDELEDLLHRYADFLRTLHANEDRKGQLREAREIYQENMSLYRDCLDEDTFNYFYGLLETITTDFLL